MWETFEKVALVAILLFSGISAFVSILSLIFKRTRLYKNKRLEALRAELDKAEKKFTCVNEAYNRGDEGLKMVMEPMLMDAKNEVERVKGEISKVENKKK